MCAKKMLKLVYFFSSIFTTKLCKNFYQLRNSFDFKQSFSKMFLKNFAFANFLACFSITSYLISLLLSLHINMLYANKSNYETQDINQIIYKSKSCRAAEFSIFCKFSMERKAGLASIAGGCLGSLLTGVLGSEKTSSSSMVIECPHILLPK